VIEEDALLKAVIADPDDDAPRLIYADWLDEQGQSERAEFIRVQVALTAIAADDPRRRQLAERERQFATENLLPALPPLLRDWSFHRGFVDRVTYAAADFLRGGADIFRAAPVRHLRLITARGCVAELAGCAHLARLLTLDLSYNFLGNLAIRSLSRCPHLASLTSLNLAHNRLRSTGARALATSPYLASLELLQLGDSPALSEEDRRLLRRRFGDRVQF
jgi:uncharacterized protein (TIGR02996 family)